VSLIYSNRSQKDIIFHQELFNLEARYSDRLKTSYILSRPQPGWKGLNGRLDANSLSSIYSEILKRDKNPIVCYLCGPQPFMSMCREALTTLGVSPDRIRSESFGSPAEVLSANPAPKSAIPTDKDLQQQEGIQRDGSLIIGKSLSDPSEKPETLVAIIGGTEVEISAHPNLSILESLMDEGHNPPYSCMSGACMACMATLEEGRVIQEDPGILTEDNIKNREILTCQAKPLSKKVKVRYHE
jgi:ring-1,2-phenylacetyl-CoA epoxidase subunit PaaE